MPHIPNISRDLRTALILGLSAFVINSAISYGTTGTIPPLGNILLLICAAALGPRAALTAFATAVVPETLISGDHLYTLRMLVLCLGCGMCSGYFPTIPVYAPVAFIWAGVIAPVLYSLSAMELVPEQWGVTQLLQQAGQDLLLAFFASAALLNRSVWVALTSLPPKISLKPILLHAFTAIGVLTLMVFFLSSLSTGVAMSPATNCWLLVGLVMAGVIPYFAAEVIQDFIASNRQEVLNDLSLSNAAGFSGLASDFWRRHNSKGVKPLFLAPHPSENRFSECALGSDSFGREDSDSVGNGWHPDNSAICAFTRSGTILFVTPEFRELAGITQNDVIGKSVQSIAINPKVQSVVLELIESTFHRGPKSTELKLNQLPDKLKFLEFSSHIPGDFTDEESSWAPGCVIISVKDITERRTVGETILEGQKLGSLGTLVSGIAHAFNNVLTNISGQASFATNTSDSDQIRRALESIISSTKNAAILVRQLLEFAERKSGDLAPENLAEVLSARVDLLKQAVGENCELSFECTELSHIAMCDTNLIMQALTNLVINSREAYPHGNGKVTVTLDEEVLDEEVADVHPGTRPGRFVRIRVRDWGAGMTPDVLARAFDPLFTTKGEGRHSGLGLASVFAIARAHDGFLTAQSRPERGTTVSIYLPVYTGTQAVSAKESQISNLSQSQPNQALEQSAKGEHILVVEDDLSIREVVSKMLRGLGYKVSICCNGDEALMKCKEEKFELILVDMVMPGLDGVEVIKQIKERWPDAKALLMTGYGGSPEEYGSKLSCIAKPFDMPTLAGAVSTALATPVAKEQPKQEITQ